jgi:hypothetical protein
LEDVWKRKKRKGRKDAENGTIRGVAQLASALAWGARNLNSTKEPFNQGLKRFGKVAFQIYSMRLLDFWVLMMYICSELNGKD